MDDATNQEEARPKVFVCYGHADDDVVVPHVDWLREHGVDVWYDEGIQVGSLWRHEIANALERATHVLFFVSSSSLASEHCDRELQFALDHHKTLVPVFLEATQLTPALRLALAPVQSLYASRHSVEALRERMLAAITADNSRSAPICTRPERLRRGRAYALIGAVAAVALGTWLLSYVWPDRLPWIRGNLPLEESANAPQEELASELAIAVLPFEDMGSDADRAWIADGLAESLAIYLSRVDGAIVKPVPRRLAEQLDPSQLAERLQVDWLAGGSVHRLEDKLLVNARLLRARDLAQAWSAQYEVVPNDMFEVQRSVAHAVVDAIEATLGRAPPPGLKRGIDEARFGTRDVRAYELYRKALDLKFSKPYVQFADAEIDEIVQISEQAVTVDPEFSQGWVGLGFSYGMVWGRSFDMRDRLAARRAFENALALDPDNPIAAGNLAVVYSGEGRWQETVRLFERRESLRSIADVGGALEGYFAAIVNLGNWKEARHAFARSVDDVRHSPARFPRRHLIHVTLAALAAGLFRDETLATKLVEDVDLNTGAVGSDALRLALAEALRAAGREADAVALVSRGFSGADGPTQLERHYMESGWTGLLAAALEHSRQDGFVCRGTMALRAELGDEAQMYACLEESVAITQCAKAATDETIGACIEGREPVGLPVWTAPCFDAYRDQPRFRAALDRAGVVGYAECCEQDAISKLIGPGPRMTRPMPR